MTDYELYCFGESGNAYKCALMLELSGLKWMPRYVDFFNGETRTPEYRAKVNEMGEAPVLIHGTKKLSQSGVILDYLASQSAQFAPQGEDERREALRWMFFDNHKFTGSIASLRFMVSITKTGETPVTEYLRGRAINALKVVNTHLASQAFMIGARPTTADFSLCAYLFYGDEVPINMTDYPHVLAWLDRIRALPRWRGPYDLMPGRRAG